MEITVSQFWLAVLVQTVTAIVIGVKYVLRVERRLMAIELVLKIRYNDKGELIGS